MSPAPDEPGLAAVLIFLVLAVVALSYVFYVLLEAIL